MRIPKHLVQRSIAALVIVLMIFTMFPNITVAYAAETNDSPVITELDESDASLEAIKTASKEHYIGLEIVELSTPIGNIATYTHGNILSPFKVSAEPNTLVSVERDKPEWDTTNKNISDFINHFGERYKIAIQDAEHPDAPVYFVSTEMTDDGKLKATLPVSSSGNLICAVVRENTTDYTNSESASSATPVESYFDQNSMQVPAKVLESTSKENTVLEYSWTYEMVENVTFSECPNDEITAEIQLSPGRMQIEPDSIIVDSKAFEKGEVTEASDGTYIIQLKVPYTDETKTEYVKGIFEPITVSFEASIEQDQFVANEEAFVVAQIMVKRETNQVQSCITETSLLDSSSVTKMTPAVNITPADMTIYEGGNGGYEGVVGADGEVIKDQTSLPHPLFYIEGSPVAGLENLDGVHFTADQGEDDTKTWTVVRDGTDKDDKALYHFVEAEGTEPVKVTYSYYDEEQQKTVTVMGDEFDAQAIGDSYRELDINIFNGANAEDFSNVTATIGETKGVALNVHSGTLTVRAVDTEDPATVTTPVADSTSAEGFTAPQTGQAVAVVPEGQTTTYTLNDTGVALPEDSAPSLLFDSIIDEIAGNDTTTRTALLQAAVDTKLGGAVDGRQYDIKYLDLVDANNGNAWITSSAGVDVYWGYPKDTDKDTEFKLIHFPGLHRDGTESGFDPDDLTSMTVDDMEEVQIISQDENGIKFHVDAGGFSPFALVWDPVDEPSPGPDPDPSPGPGPVGPVDPTPELERGDHYAYIVGYEDDTIRPQNNITRAEVATIFFRLLTDESREAYFTTDCDFTDVNGSAWYANTVATLSNAGILAGYPDGSFRPNDPITRAEFAAIATRFDDLAAADSSFTDIDGHWAEDAINAAYGAGWVGGYPDGTFRPNNNITRAEVMSLVNRVLDREVDEDGMLDDMLTWIDNEPGTWYYEAVQEATNSHDYEREDADSVETWTQINEPIDWDKVEEELLN